MSGNILQRASLAAAATVLLCLPPLCAIAQVQFDLPAEPLAQALKALAIQAGLNVYYDPSAVAGIRAQAVKADVDPRTAFARLLSGTDLVAVYVDQNTVRVVRKDSARDKKNHTSSARTRKISAKGAAKYVPPAESRKADPADHDASKNFNSIAESNIESSALKPVIVTAQRYAAQPEYDVPISLTVLSSRDLLAQGDTNLNTLQFFAPGLSVGNTRAERRIVIGGVSNLNGHGGLVSEYINNADVTASPSLFGYNSANLETYDLKRVEVLMGPQGTLYGEGAEGGAIHFVTNGPNPDKYEVGLRGENLFTVGGTPTERLFPVINIPLADGKAALRLSGEYAHNGGWIDEPAAHQKGINSDDISDTRIEALWRPIPKLALKLMQIFHNESYGTNQGENSNGIYTPVFGLPVAPRGSEKFYVGNLEVDYTIPKVGTIVSSSTYFKDTNINYNFPEVLESKINGTLNVPVAQITYVPNAYRYHHYTEELRLHNAIGAWQYTVGAFYKQAFVTSFPSAGCIGAIGLTLTSDVASAFFSNPNLSCIFFGQLTESRSWSGFVDTSYQVAHRLTVEAGVRLFTNTQQFIAVGNPGKLSGTFKSTDPQASIVYKTPWHLNVYGDVRKGFRSGGFNGYQLPLFGPESVWWYEAGIKTRRMHTFSGSMEFHFARYSNYQIFGEKRLYSSTGTEIPVTETANGGTVHIKGVTAKFLWHPAPRWTLGMNGDYENSRFVAITLLNTSNNVGDPVDLVPRYEVTASVQKDFLIGRRATFARFDYSQRAPDTYRLRDLGIYGVSDHIYLLNFTSGIQWNSNLKLGIEAQNILNDRAYVDPNVEDLAGKTRPMTIGFYFDAMF